MLSGCKFIQRKNNDIAIFLLVLALLCVVKYLVCGERYSQIVPAWSMLFKIEFSPPPLTIVLNIVRYVLPPRESMRMSRNLSNSKFCKCLLLTLLTLISKRTSTNSPFVNLLIASTPVLLSNVSPKRFRNKKSCAGTMECSGFVETGLTSCKEKKNQTKRRENQKRARITSVFMIQQVSTKTKIILIYFVQTRILTISIF